MPPHPATCICCVRVAAQGKPAGSAAAPCCLRVRVAAEARVRFCCSPRVSSRATMQRRHHSTLRTCGCPCALHQAVRLLPRRRLHRLHALRHVFRCVTRWEGIIYDHLYANDPILRGIYFKASEYLPA
jgi:hypothetical protein